MIGFLAQVLPGLFKIGGKLIVDKDKQAEYAFKVQEMTFRMMETMLNAKTYPWIDGLVKLAYAGDQIIKGLFRPVGAAAALGFVIYAEMNHIELSGTVETILVGIFPGWMASRHVEKVKKTKVPKAQDVWEEDEYDW